MNENLIELLEQKIGILANIIPKNIAKFENGNLVDLYLSRIGINNIPEDFFEDPFFNNLNKLHLNTNKLTIIPSNLFRPLKNLEYLSIRKNQLYELNKNSFQGMNKLKTLNLSNNILTEINEKTFNLPSLESLNLKQNQITTLPDNLFESCPNLKFLNLSMNLFNKIPVNSLLSLNNLENLLLSKNLVPYEFAKDFISKKGIKLIFTQFNEYINLNKNKGSMGFQEFNEDLIRQYIFNQLQATYHYIINTPVLQHSLKNLILSYMVKNFHLLISHINNETPKELEFNQIIFTWHYCLNIFSPIQQELDKFLNNSERKRRALERSAARMKEMEVSIIEDGGILETDEMLQIRCKLDDVEFEDHAFHSILKKFWSWNNPNLSKLFL